MLNIEHSNEICFYHNICGENQKNTVNEDPVNPENICYPLISLNFVFSQYILEQIIKMLFKLRKYIVNVPPNIYILAIAV
jgi:hypothetical protein